MEEVTEDMKSINLSSEEKDAAAFLRERFLFLIASLPSDKVSTIELFNRTQVQAQIRAFDLSFENVFVENLKATSSQVSIPKALLRTNDVLTITYEDI